MAALAARPERLHEVLIFRAGSIRAALPAGVVEDVPGTLAILPVRNAPGGIIGVTDFQGATVAVVDTHWRFDFPVAASIETYAYIVVRLGSSFAVLRVDEVEAAALVPASAFEMLVVPGSGEGLGYLRGVVRFKGEDLPLLDAEQLISLPAVHDAARRAS